MKIVAYASSTRPNHLWSAAQFNSALPKNRTDADIPLVALADVAALRLSVSDEEIEAFGLAFWPVNAASKIDEFRDDIRKALIASKATA